jgi:hypothetical protein
MVKNDVKNKLEYLCRAINDMDTKCEAGYVYKNIKCPDIIEYTTLYDGQLREFEQYEFRALELITQLYLRSIVLDCLNGNISNSENLKHIQITYSDWLLVTIGNFILKNSSKLEKKKECVE